ncbi:hypothetical protein IWW36_002198 [Coemansia brasiliensis]|uniref:Uncharacterized protein n=1 Tax=Coemansia brasiliensis TaxID=2650707 RepID=A0A9W8LZN9_9FUNG|nr:hypothetical protein IWW36_002198 [Coemansia brasiliensis]
MQPPFATANMNDIYPSMAAHCYYVPANVVPAYEQQEQEQEQPMEFDNTMGANSVTFERKIAIKRGRDNEDYETTTQRCTYYRNSVVAISAKRTKAVETHV